MRALTVRMLYAIHHTVTCAQVVNTLETPDHWQLLRRFLEALPFAAYLENLDGRIVELNTLGAEMFGYQREELLGSHVHCLLSEATRARFWGMVQLLKKTGRIDVYAEGLRKDGTLFPTHMIGRLIQLGNREYALVLVQDVTAQRRVLCRQAAVQRMESLRTLAAGVAHDFNNMLQLIQLNIERALVKARAAPDVYGLLQRALSGLSQATELVNQLLIFSLGAPSCPEIIDLNQLVREVAELLEPAVAPDAIVHLDLAEGLWPVEADPAQVRQVLMNLAKNAQQAIAAKRRECGIAQPGRITLKTRNVQTHEAPHQHHPYAKPGRYVCLQVADTGVGMRAEVMDRAFEPFFTTRSSEGGTGLGLAVVHGIVSQHGGWIECTSKPGEGTTFYVYLPAAEMETRGRCGS